ncbi:hypothetical protein X777_02102 [Ooceraea biroi]|uniref:Uncharacterized protein n=1 Tax=Ooceraea biroi TaxID=2015173 RepID=A0A026WNB7_OOCBI|nr:hypothetical protein X777_02102 [Ooceraea biroi]
MQKEEKVDTARGFLADDEEIGVEKKGCFPSGRRRRPERARCSARRGGKRGFLTGRTEEGYVVERWWIEEGRGRVGGRREGGWKRKAVRPRESGEEKRKKNRRRWRRKRARRGVVLTRTGAFLIIICLSLGISREERGRPCGERRQRGVDGRVPRKKRGRTEEKEGSAARRKKEREGRGPPKESQEARGKEREGKTEAGGWEREIARRGQGGQRERERTLLTPPSIQDGVGSGSPRH